jgi:hypothetical protein
VLLFSLFDAEAVLWCAVVLSDDLTCALGCDVVVSRPVQSFFSVLIRQEHHARGLSARNQTWLSGTEGSRPDRPSDPPALAQTTQK